MNELPRSLTSILADVNKAEDKNSAFIISATLNLYMENLRRCHNRVLLIPQDIVNIFQILDMLLLPPIPEGSSYTMEGRDRKLTPEEEKQLNDVVERETISVGRRV